MKQDQPAAHDLAGTVRDYLETLIPQVEETHRFDLRVAVHLLGIAVPRTVVTKVSHAITIQVRGQRLRVASIA